MRWVVARIATIYRLSNDLLAEPSGSGFAAPSTLGNFQRVGRLSRSVHKINFHLPLNTEPIKVSKSM